MRPSPETPTIPMMPITVLWTKLIRRVEVVQNRVLVAELSKYQLVVLYLWSSTDNTVFASCLV